MIEQLDGDDLYWVDGLTLIEVTSALRRLVNRELLPSDTAERGLKWLGGLVTKRRPIGQAELARIWELRHAITPYDAAYVALTERIQADTGGRAVLLTADRRLAESHAVVCPVEVYSTPS